MPRKKRTRVKPLEERNPAAVESGRRGAVARWGDKIGTPMTMVRLRKSTSRRITALAHAKGQSVPEYVEDLVPDVPVSSN